MLFCCSAAARAVREVLISATALQARSAIPVKQDYYMPEDERRAGDADVDVPALDLDAISSHSDKGETDEDDMSEDDSSAGGSGPVSKEDAKHRCEPPSIGQGAFPKALPSSGPKDSKRKRCDTDVQNEGHDSDGYGDGGLSWEAVLACVQVCPGHILSEHNLLSACLPVP